MINEENVEVSTAAENDFKQRLDILSMILSLKANDREIKHTDFELIFSLFKKMIQNDQDDFFIDNKRQPAIVASLERSEQIYQLDKAEEIQELFIDLKTDDPTDFLLFPVCFCVNEEERPPRHLTALTFYKKNDHLLMIHVDKEKYFKESTVSYVEIPMTNMEILSELLLFSRDRIESGAFSVLKKIETIAGEFQRLPMIEMKGQMIGNCVVSEIEAALKVALFNCKVDLFSFEADEVVIPKWNLFHDDSTLEMRLRFLEALKVANQEWNAQFDYIFDYYLYRKGHTTKTSLLHINRSTYQWYNLIQTVFEMDPYIHEMKNGNGNPPVLDETKLVKRLDQTVESLSELYQVALKDVNEEELTRMLKFDGCLLSIVEDRSAIMEIPVAKEMNQWLLSGLADRFEENLEELKRRAEVRKNEWQISHEEKGFAQFAEPWLPTSNTHFSQPEQLEVKEIDEFARRIDMLALTLSLKSSNNFCVSPENYELLFSTYIKMIENDQDDFFIDKKRQPKIIRSLERTIDLYRLGQPNDLKIVLENLRNNDPTDFLLFPTSYFFPDPDELGYVCGLTVYKRGGQFVVMQVDKEKVIGAGSVSYVQLSAAKVEELSKVLFSTRDLLNFRPYETLIKIEALSHPFQKIPAIQLARPMSDNHAVSQIETTLRIILFNCNHSLFDLPHRPKITPKWNRQLPYPTLEMKRRFVHALKGDNPDWNQQYEYVFGFYLYRKYSYSQIKYGVLANHKDEWYQNVYLLYANDPYIKVILNNGGYIPSVLNSHIKEVILEVVDPIGQLYQSKLRQVELIDLHDADERIRKEIQLTRERKAYIQIPIAEKITSSLIIGLQEKRKDIQEEIKYRDKKKQLDLFSEKSTQINQQWFPFSYHHRSTQTARPLPANSEQLAVCSSQKNKLSSVLAHVKQHAQVISKDLARKPAVYELKRQ
ncbi:hypothetical protein [Candidatus Enterococcus mangumiae]|uniref:Uncharacterized protein n=1 Tax=Candidatus Enterococcus mangumiae TaxID=2230878 RepID=A0ABZ2SUW4_9ENTE|nr:hypothetical protein [Enterococcus sp. DIV1094]MBO0488888.1 hypothetical protein [Enterococcus sp. DIV1094]